MVTTADGSTAAAPRQSQLPLLVLGFVVVSWGAGPVITKLITTHPVIGVVIRFALSVGRSRTPNPNRPDFGRWPRGRVLSRRQRLSVGSEPGLVATAKR